MEKRRAQAVLKSLQPYTAQPGSTPQADTQQGREAAITQQLQLVQQLRLQCQEQLDRCVTARPFKQAAHASGLTVLDVVLDLPNMLLLVAASPPQRL